MDVEYDAALKAAMKLRRSVTALARPLRALRADHGISGAQLSLLGRLHRARRAMTASELARLERLQPQSLTRIIAELNRRGLIRRQPDEADRRHVLMQITPAGTELLIRDACRQDQWLAQAMAAKLSKAERELVAIAAELLDGLAAGSVDAEHAEDEQQPGGKQGRAE